MRRERERGAAREGKDGHNLPRTRRRARRAPLVGSNARTHSIMPSLACQSTALEKPLLLLAAYRHLYPKTTNQNRIYWKNVDYGSHTVSCLCFGARYRQAWRKSRWKFE